MAIEPKNQTRELDCIRYAVKREEIKQRIHVFELDTSLNAQEKEKAIDGVIDEAKHEQKLEDEEALHPVLARLQEIHKKNVKADLESAKKEAAVAMGAPAEEPEPTKAAVAPMDMDGFMPPELMGNMEVVAAQK